MIQNLIQPALFGRKRKKYKINIMTLEEFEDHQKQMLFDDKQRMVDKLVDLQIKHNEVCENIHKLQTVEKKFVQLIKETNKELKKIEEKIELANS